MYTKLYCRVVPTEPSPYNVAEKENLICAWAMSCSKNKNYSEFYKRKEDKNSVMKGGEICLHEMKYCKLLLVFKEVHNIGLFHEDILNLNLLFLFPRLWWVCGWVCLFGIGCCIWKE